LGITSSFGSRVIVISLTLLFPRSASPPVKDSFGAEVGITSSSHLVQSTETGIPVAVPILTEQSVNDTNSTLSAASAVADKWNIVPDCLKLTSCGN
jgi:hypothetical protein